MPETVGHSAGKVADSWVYNCVRRLIYGNQAVIFADDIQIHFFRYYVFVSSSNSISASSMSPSDTLALTWTGTEFNISCLNVSAFYQPSDMCNLVSEDV